jgi:hypothetical protein
MLRLNVMLVAVIGAACGPQAPTLSGPSAFATAGALSAFVFAPDPNGPPIQLNWIEIVIHDDAAAGNCVMPRQGSRAVTVAIAHPADSEPLTPGEYPVLRDPARSGAVRVFKEGRQLFFSESGDVVIDSLDPKHIAGSFSVGLINFDGQTEKLSGSFAAPRCQFD